VPARPWDDWNPGAYALDTAHLSDDQDLLYRRLLDVHWRDESLPADPARIRVLARATHWSDERFAAAWSEVRLFFDESGDRLTQKRMRGRLASVKREIHAKKRAGKARWNKRLQAPAQHDQCSSYSLCSPEPDPEPDLDLDLLPSSLRSEYRTRLSLPQPDPRR